MPIRKFLLGSAFYSVGNMVGAGLNMVFQFILIMFLTINEYGIIQPLLQFVGLLILPLSAYQFALTKHYSNMSDEELAQESLYTASKINKISIILTGIWLLLIPVFKNVFHIDDTYIFVLLFFSLLMNTLQIPYVCRLQAEKKFFMAGFAQILQGCTRISLGVICVWIYPTIWGAMYGILLSNVAFVLGNVFEYKKEVFKSVDRTFIPKKFSLRLLFVSLGSVGLFSLLIYSDTVLVRMLSPGDSALFSSSNLLGKGMIFLTTGISFVILPLMASSVKGSKKSLWIGFACLVILVLAYAMFFFITAPFLAQILFKDEPQIFTHFQTFMPYYNLMFIPYPLIYYFLNYYLVKESSFYPYLLAVGVGLLYGGIAYHHGTIYEITNVIGLVGYSLLVIVIAHALISKDKGSIHEEQIDESSIENLI